MKNLLLILAFIFAGIFTTNAQTIESTKKFGGYKFVQGTNKMTMGELYKAMTPESESLYIMKKAKGNHALAQVMGGLGGFGIGLPLGAQIAGGDPNWIFAGVGAGLIIISIPVSSKANKEAKRAVDLHNASLATGYQSDFKPEFSIVGNSNGIGLSIQF